MRRAPPTATATAAAIALRNRLHRAVFAASGGRLLRRWGGVPVVMLTTVGRRTGQPRSTMLVTPASDGDAYVVVASNGGADRDPDWFRNLVARPEVTVLTAGRREIRQARVATAEERARLWPRITARSPAYGRYRQRTSREIPLVLLAAVTAGEADPPPAPRS